MSSDTLVIEILLVLVLLFQGAGFLAYLLNRSLIAEARAFYTKERDIHQRMLRTSTIMQEMVDDMRRAVDRLVIQITAFSTEGAVGTREALEENRRLLEEILELLLHQGEVR